jgi:tetratricopeptide (TPR) repeat protein
MHGPFSDGIALLERVLGQPVGRETLGRLFYRAGWLLYLAGRLAEALECYRQALEIAREVGNRRGEGHALGGLAVLHREQGRIPEALEHHHQTLAIAREVGNRRGEGHTLGGLAVLHREQGRIPEALEHFHQAIEIAREVGNRLSEGHTLGGLAILHCEQGHVAEALEHHHQSLAIIREVGDRRQEGLALGNLGDLLLLQGDSQSAETHLLQAIPICDETWSVAAGVFRGSLALLRAQQGAFDEARALLDKGEPQVRGVYKLELGKLLCKKARVEQLAGDLGVAAAALAEAESIDIELGSDPDAELSKLLAETRAALDS